MKKIFSLFCCLLWATLSFSQNSGEIEMATLLRSSGKIYVVIAVICIVFIGLAIYLFSIDKKVGRIEKGENE